MHTPRLYTLLAKTAADLTAIVATFNEGDFAYVQDAPATGYYTFFPGGPGPVGSIPASGAQGYFAPFAGGGGGGPAHRSVQQAGITPAGGTFTLAFASPMPTTNYDVFVETDYFVSYYVTNKTVSGFDLVVGVGTGGNANAQAFGRI